MTTTETTDARAEALRIVNGITKSDMELLPADVRRAVAHRIAQVKHGEGHWFSDPDFTLHYAEQCRDYVTMAKRRAEKGAVN